MRQLRGAGHDVSDGVNAGLAGLLVLSRDPSLAVIGLHVGLLALVRQTALRGLVRAGDLIDLDAGDLTGTSVETPDDREVER